MGMKRSTKDAGMPQTSKKAKANKHLLTEGELREVFNCLDRGSIDKCSALTRSFHSTSLRAEPLRTLTAAHLSYYAPIKFYSIRFTYTAPSKAGPSVQRPLEKVIEPMAAAENNWDKMLDAFMNGLQFSYVSDEFRLTNITVDRVFVARLKKLDTDFKCESGGIYLENVSLTDDVDPWDFLGSFPSFRALNKSTLGLLEEDGKSNDAFLRTLAERGIWDHGECALPAGDEKSILDYLFGEYEDDERGRKLRVSCPDISEDFLLNLVKACRKRGGEHKFEVRIVTTTWQNIEELTVSGEEEDIGEEHHQTLWRFRFDDMPDLHVEYVVPSDPDDGEIH
ncbi:hypothetical protein AAVH_38739, partial [Aphelenchoides avenae]